MSELAPVPSPYEGQKLGIGTHLKISAYWFATNFLWGALLISILPGEMKAMAESYRVLAISLFTGLGAVIAIVVPLVFGALSDRCVSRWGRRRPYMAAGVGLNVFGLILMGAIFAFAPALPPPVRDDPGIGETLRALLTSPTYLAFLLAYMVVQFGNNVTSAAYMGVIPDLVPEDQRGVASGYMALMSQGGTLFGIVSMILVGALRLPEAAKYLVLIVVLVGVALVTILGIRENPLPSRPPKIVWSAYAKSLWIDPKEHPDFAWVWITRALVMLGFYSVLPFVNYYMDDVIRSRNVEKDAGAVLAIILVASTLSALKAGKLSDRIGRKKVVYVSNAVIAVFALGFIFCRTLEQVLFVGILFGLGYGAYISVDYALGTDVLPSQNDAAKEMAVWHIAMTLPQSIAAPIAGILITRFGMTETVVEGVKVPHYTVAGYSAVFVLCSVSFALGAYLLKNVRGVR